MRPFLQGNLPHVVRTGIWEGRGGQGPLSYKVSVSPQYLAVSQHYSVFRVTCETYLLMGELAKARMGIGTILSSSSTSETTKALYELMTPFPNLGWHCSDLSAGSSCACEPVLMRTWSCLTLEAEWYVLAQSLSGYMQDWHMVGYPSSTFYRDRCRYPMIMKEWS